LPGPVSDEGIAQKVKDRPLLLAASFNDGQDALNKSAAGIGLSAMRVAAPDDGMTQRAFGTVVSWFKTRDGHKTPQISIGSQEQATGGGGFRRGNGQPHRHQCRI
jgi:hypothetical protein